MTNTGSQPTRTEAEEKARLERARLAYDEWLDSFASSFLSHVNEESQFMSAKAFQAGADFTLSELEAANKRIAELEASLSQSMQAISNTLALGSEQYPESAKFTVEGRKNGFVAFTIDSLIHEHLEKAAENAQLLLSTER